MYQTPELLGEDVGTQLPEGVGQKPSKGERKEKGRGGKRNAWFAQGHPQKFITKNTYNETDMLTFLIIKLG